MNKDWPQKGESMRNPHRYTQVFWIPGAFSKVLRILEINGYL